MKSANFCSSRKSAKSSRKSVKSTQKKKKKIESNILDTTFLDTKINLFVWFIYCINAGARVLLYI